MSDDALVLREVSEALWRDFATEARRPRPDAPAAEHPVLSKWARARALGASVEGPPPEEHLVRGEALRMHAERTELLEHLAEDELDRASGHVSPHDYLLVLADPAGVVVRTQAGGRFADDARRVRLIAGAKWSEASRGTNAIGTAIAERRPVFVRGSAHLARRFHELVCYAAPIFDADGSLCAVLDATSGFERADDGVGAAVIRTARTISTALRDHAFGRAGAAVTRTLARALDRMEGVAMLVEPPGRVTQMNAGARVLLGERAGLPVERALGLDMAALVREGRHASGETITVGGRRHGVRVEPIETADGKLIALLCFLEPRVGAARSPRRLALAPSPSPFAAVFSADPTLDAALSWAGRIADSTVPVLLLAETGSGKELVARAIHAASGRRDGPFVPVNCGSIAPSLLESELFGYGPSAFTGAEKSGRQGLFAVASSGTIFLDEVAEMTPAMQASLLRVLEDGTYRRVGETAPMRADVRVVSATCRDLPAMVEAGTFRRDLYYRLKGTEVALPPLRARRDRDALAQHLCADLALARGIVPAPTLSAATLALFARHAWPGNVRELRSILEVALILVGRGTSIEPEHLPPDMARIADVASEPAGASSDLSTAERSTVRRALAEVQGNVSSAAKRLGVARSTLYRMMKKHGLVQG
jgi:sigma-54 dependent transcriptional regulator, acetoin dehydrogenase operon transcriptional activator AcoR